MFERPKYGEKSVLVQVNFPNTDFPEEDLMEFQELARSAGAICLGIFQANRDTPDPKYFIGQGKAQEIAEFVKSQNIELVIFNHELTPSQERNLEQLFKTRVINRIGLILDIFAQRAQTHEGKLQVELAQLHHLSTRLVRGWTHLERQKGGIGLRGPGETQLESDRRLVRKRIEIIQQRLEKIRKQRDQTRRNRRKALMPTVTIVGYTNAGKSTLFNVLSGANVYAADQLFATLDPTFRQLNLPGFGSIILADTVGFIRNLPHELIEAFSATLEETQDANLLLHVMDIQDTEREFHAEQVNKVLEEIGAEAVPRLLVLNKIDVLAEPTPGIDYDVQGKPFRVRVSAKNKLGLEALKQAIAAHIFGEPLYRTVILGCEQGKLRAKLYAMKAVTHEHLNSQGDWVISVCMLKQEFENLFPQENEEEG